MLKRHQTLMKLGRNDRCRGDLSINDLRGTTKHFIKAFRSRAPENQNLRFATSPSPAGGVGHELLVQAVLRAVVRRHHVRHHVVAHLAQRGDASLGGGSESGKPHMAGVTP
eukprot:gene14521-biopygen4499